MMPAHNNEIPTNELTEAEITEAEITYARAADKLRVEDDGLGFVDAVWLARWRGQKAKPCDIPPPGWVCSRAKGHEGPCAAWPTNRCFK